MRRTLPRPHPFTRRNSGHTIWEWKGTFFVLTPDRKQIPGMHFKSRSEAEAALARLSAGGASAPAAAAVAAPRPAPHLREVSERHAGGNPDAEIMRRAPQQPQEFSEWNTRADEGWLDDRVRKFDRAIAAVGLELPVMTAEAYTRRVESFEGVPPMPKLPPRFRWVTNRKIEEVGHPVHYVLVNCGPGNMRTGPAVERYENGRETNHACFRGLQFTRTFTDSVQFERPHGLQNAADFTVRFPPMRESGVTYWLKGGRLRGIEQPHAFYWMRAEKPADGKINDTFRLVLFGVKGAGQPDLILDGPSPWLHTQLRRLYVVGLLSNLPDGKYEERLEREATEEKLRVERAERVRIEREAAEHRVRQEKEEREREVLRQRQREEERRAEEARREAQRIKAEREAEEAAQARAAAMAQAAARAQAEAQASARQRPQVTQAAGRELAPTNVNEYLSTITPEKAIELTKAVLQIHVDNDRYTQRHYRADPDTFEELYNGMYDGALADGLVLGFLNLPVDIKNWRERTAFGSARYNYMDGTAPARPTGTLPADDFEKIHEWARNFWTYGRSRAEESKVKPRPL